MFGDRPFRHWPTTVATGVIFALLFEAVYALAMTLIGEGYPGAAEAMIFGLIAFLGFLAAVAIVRVQQDRERRGGTDQP